MSIGRQQANKVDFSQTYDLEDLIDVGRSGVLSPPKIKGRRALKRAALKKITSAGLIAPLLAAEGCLSLGKKDVPLAADDNESSAKQGAADNGASSMSSDKNTTTAPNNGGATVTPTDHSPAAHAGNGDSLSGPVTLEAMNDHFDTGAGAPINIAASQLQANDIHSNTRSLELVRVFDAVNGTVVFDGAIVQFIPDEGFEGTASFKYEVRDSNGGISQAIVEIDVGEGGMAHDDPHPDAGAGGMAHDEPHPDAGAGGMHGDGGDHAGHPHPDDPSKASEHVALLDLAPISEATHVAVNNGSWFDPNTWAGGETPGEGAKVVIPHGLSVTYDGESSVSLFTVRVDGGLTFATDKDTFMEVDTFIVTPSGKLTIGTIENPVAAGVETVIQIADNGPIDVAWDPMLLSRGLISHGEVEIHGAEKDSF